MRAGENPFRTERLSGVRFRYRDFAREELLARLAANHFRGAIVGPHGSGKTMLLEELARSLETAGWKVRLLRAGRRVKPAAHVGEIVLLDAAERLNHFQWLLFRVRSRHATGLVITAHKRGRLPTLAELSTTPELLAEIVSELLGESFPIEEARRLYRDHSGDLRAALLALYDHCR